MIDAQELLFVVDEENRPLDPVERKIAHRDGLWHRTVGVWVINGQGQLLCQKRSVKKDKHPGKWDAFFWWAHGSGG